MKKTTELSKNIEFILNINIELADIVFSSILVSPEPNSI